MSNIKNILAKYEIDNSELLTELDGLYSEMASNQDEESVPLWKFKKTYKKMQELQAIAAEFETEKEKYESKITELESSTKDLSNYKTKYEEYQTKQQEADKKEWDDIKKQIYVKDDDAKYKKYSKVYPKFTFEEETPEQISKNLEMFKVYKDVNFWDFENKEFNDKTPKPPDKNITKDPLYGAFGK